MSLLFLISQNPLPIRRQEFLRFLCAGALGFLVDGGLLTLLMQAQWEILPARLISFFIAVTLTWLINRLWTFQSKTRLKMSREYAGYLATQVIGALINLIFFFLFIKLHPELRNTPLVPFAFGATISTAFNYFVLKRYLFGK